MNNSQLLLDISAESLKTKHIGRLRLYRLSDTLYSLRYQDVGEIVTADIDSVRIEIKNKLVRFYEETDALQCCFLINDRRHLELLRSAYQRCQETCNLALELSTRLRDVYFEGLRQLSSQEDPNLLCDEVGLLQREAFVTFSREISADPMEPSQCVLPQKKTLSILNSLDIPTQVATKEKKIDVVTCFYCDQTSADASHLQFFIHPYVPRTFDRKRTIICSICIENWNDYRQRALAESQLILPGEINEELCALCSDTPETLILCSTCQRSYCRGCLEKTVVDRRVQKSIFEQSDWKCFCCAQQVETRPLLTKESWKQWTSKFTETPTKKARDVIHRAVVTQTKDEKKTKIIPLVTPLAPATVAPVSLLSGDVPHASNVGVSSAGSSKKDISLSSTFVDQVQSVRKRGRPRRKNIENDPEPKVETITKQTQSCELDEVYYFGQYLRYLEEFYSRFDRQYQSVLNNKNGGKSKWPSLPTDEVCFLCKDGGDLIECDHCRRGRNPSHRCLKVYHNYCLSFDVTDDNVSWLCPRHFCSCCGSKNLKYMCMFCPISICSNCPTKYATKYNSDKFCEVVGPKTGEFSSGEVVAIACETCCNLINKALNQEEKLANEQFYTRIGPLKSFLSIGSSLDKSDQHASPQTHVENDIDENEESSLVKKQRS